METTPLVTPVTWPFIGFIVAISVLAELHVPPGVEAVKVVVEPIQIFIPPNTAVGGLVTVIDLLKAVAHGNSIGLGVKT